MTTTTETENPHGKNPYGSAESTFNTDTETPKPTLEQVLGALKIIGDAHNTGAIKPMIEEGHFGGGFMLFAESRFVGKRGNGETIVIGMTDCMSQKLGTTIALTLPTALAAAFGTIMSEALAFRKASGFVIKDTNRGG